jgi:2-polyprenyl-3-methyl-5-hydroxy-6-metoxy-1,4-benzoquinol methylase
LYEEAKDAYERYLAVGTWTPEVSDAWLMLGKCGIGLDDTDLAWQSVCHALRINADLSEGMQLLALLSGPENRRKWLEYSALSTNHKAHFIRDVPGLEIVEEKDATYYKRIFDTNPDLSRYEELYNTVASMCSGRVLDMGCGTGELKKYMPDYCLYHGFDFTEAAKGEGFSFGDIYEYPLEGYQTFVMLEVLEHVDDLRVLRRIPPSSNVIFSVPSFRDPSHLRTYTMEMMTDRFSEFFCSMEVRRFNLIAGKWQHVEQESDAYILLCEAVTK